MQGRLTSRIGIMALIGGLYLTNYGLGVIQAAAAPPLKEGVLEGVTQNWDKVLPAEQRFIVLSAFGGAAVRDNETGLVWERSPLITTHVWGVARFECTSRTTGGRKGWRLPSVHELASLIDPNAQASPMLPPGHPFNDVQGAGSGYWSATAFSGSDAVAWDMSFENGHVGSGAKDVARYVWCLRGPMNADTY